mgnify:CR=1 FL=1|tara:strand:+ start:99 stop:458 length:360 start_codon:yes stop_codon:yes gene_type:complete
MKLTKQQLKQIIKEELESVLESQSNDMTQFGLRGPGDWGTHSSQPEEGADPEEVFGSTAGLSQGPTTDLASELERELAPLMIRGDSREEMITYLSELQMDLGGVFPEDAVDWWLERNQS